MNQVMLYILHVPPAATRGSFSSNLTAEEVAIANSTNTLIFVNTVETALEVSKFLKKAGKCDGCVRVPCPDYCAFSQPLG